MASSELSIAHLCDMLSAKSIEHALRVLADATGATAVLFDCSGQAVVGPVAGSAFMRRLLDSEQGRQAVISAHRSVIAPHEQAAGAAMNSRGPHPPVNCRGPQPGMTYHGPQPQPGGEGAAGILVAAGLDCFAIPLMHDGRCAGTMTFGGRPRQPIPAEVVAEIASAAGVPSADLQQAADELKPWDTARASAARNMAALVAELLADLCVQEENLRRRIEELTTVYNVAGLLAESLDLQEILDKTTRMVCEVMKVKACSIRMLDEATGNLTVRAVHNLSQEYLDKGPVTVAENPIDAVAVSGEIVRIVDAPNDPRTRYPEQMRREGIVSGLVCGMIHRGKAVGVLRVYTGEPHTFSSFEESLLRAVAAQAAAAIVNARLLAETIEAERYARQIAYAGEVQRRMIPAHPPVYEHAEIGAVYRPTYDVGGDFYDFITLPNGNLGVAIADVSGKGVPASLLMASLRAALRVYANFTYDINHIMVALNQHVCQETKTGEFATLFYGVLSPDGNRLTCCNAGHDPPMLLRDGRVHYLGTGGMVLGVERETTFDRELVHLRRGDVLLLYTDGAVEALNFNDQQFGRERLAASFQRHADQPAQLIAQNILWDIRRFRGLADRIDDLTMVVLKIK